MTRNQKGIIGFFILGLFLNLLALPIMVIREYYQSKVYNIPLEKDDLVRYSIIIIISSIINILIILAIC